MHPFVSDFLKITLQQVKYKEVHTYLAQELNDHIELLKEELMDKGMSEEIAYQEAIKQMGNPKALGKNLDEIHKPKIEWSVVIMLTAIIAIGITVVTSVFKNCLSYLSISSIYKYYIYIGMGIIVFLALYYMDYRKLEKKSGYLFIIASIIMLMILTKGINVNGSRRWLHIGPIIISYNIAIPLFIISYVGFIKKWENQGIKGYLLLIVTGAFSVIINMLMNTEQGVFITSIFLYSFITYIMSKSFKGNRKKVGRAVCGGIILMLGIGIYNIICKPWKMDRLLGWINPDRDPQGTGYVYKTIRYILNGATYFGKGDEISIYAEQYLPNSQNDYIFTYIIGTMGYFVAGGIVLLVGILIIRCFNSIKLVRDEYGKMVLKAITVYFLIQYAMGFLGGIGLAPVATTIPFISYSGVKIVYDLGLMGLFLGVYRRKDIIMPSQLVKNEV